MVKIMSMACLLVCALMVAQPAAARTADDPAVILRVTGDVDTPLALTAADLDSLPRYEVAAVIHDRKVTFKGFALRDVLRRAGPPHGIEVAQAVVVAKARDGYFAVFALVELEADFTDRLIIAAEEKDGETLSAKEGPLRSVVQGEKLATRSVRQLNELEIQLIREKP